MQDAGIRMARYFGAIIENRDYITNQHARRVGMITFVLLNKLRAMFPEYGLDDNKIKLISSAATLHDAGKLRLPDSIVNKPSRLTDEEYEIYQSHTYKGKKMFKDVASHLPKGDEDRAFFKYAASICMNHHERYDGDGYPEKKKGEDIPIGSQVVGLADAYEDALSDRIHKAAISKLEVYDMIVNGECGSFSPKLIQVFIAARAELEELLAREEENLQ
ncbi:MAG: HD domain-containing phosphohydrolase [Eubacterium sp.]|nr:HD domain-containing phosphohydrolase [Eubacterium sp.]